MDSYNKLLRENITKKYKKAPAKCYRRNKSGCEICGCTVASSRSNGRYCKQKRFYYTKRPQG